AAGAAPTVTGRVNLTGPPGTPRGQMFELRGRGLPRVNTSGTGDLHVRVQLWTPDRLTEREAQVIQELAKVQRSVPVDRGKSFWSRMRYAIGA
ncbi:MAG: DnaJ C-terminal domain-containing protein, partial [Gemmatimonadaceae bacterium]